jgi:hypothetical protein
MTLRNIGGLHQAYSGLYPESRLYSRINYAQIHCRPSSSTFAFGWWVRTSAGTMAVLLKLLVVFLSVFRQIPG